MLVARRDPFHPAAQNSSHSDFAADHRDFRAPRLTRTMTALQMVGTLLAIPVGIGSAYSIYRANFSVETTCQSLRANIVSMLDKSVDARTRHMLVRRDVVAFEQTCGSVDPDATAAFKALLTADKAAAPAAAPVPAPRVETKPAEAKAKDVARKTDPQPEAVARQRPPALNTVAVEAKPAQVNAAVSDTVRLAAVRGALMPNGPETAKPAAPAEVVVVQPAPAASAAPQVGVRSPHLEAENRAPVPAMKLAAPAAVPNLPPLSVAAPALPSTEVAPAPAPMQAADHPVPPASIPAATTETNESAREPKSRFSGWVAQIPFVGRMIESK